MQRYGAVLHVVHPNKDIFPDKCIGKTLVNMSAIAISSTIAHSYWILENKAQEK